MEEIGMANKGYTNKCIIETREAQTVAELIESLQEMLRFIGQDGDVVYVENGDVKHVDLRLIENTLTNGSKVYDVRVS
jgi:hypothetical protein